MLKILLVYLGGILTGGLIGMIFMCLCISAGQADRNNER